MCKRKVFENAIIWDFSFLQTKEWIHVQKKKKKRVYKKGKKKLLGIETNVEQWLWNNLVQSYMTRELNDFQIYHLTFPWKNNSGQEPRSFPFFVLQ